jgi:hypothetical protein
MTYEETARVVAVLMAHWPNHPIPNPDATIAAYQLGLSDVPYQLGMAAAEKAIRTSRFFPTVAELRDIILDTLLDFPSAEEAWGEIKRGFSYGGIYGEPEWSCMPVAQAVRAIGWRVLCTSPEGGSDMAERFTLTYRTYRKRALYDVDIAALWSGQQEAPRLVRGEPEYRTSSVAVMEHDS